MVLPSFGSRRSPLDPESAIGLITPYRDQVGALQSAVEKEMREHYRGKGDQKITATIMSALDDILAASDSDDDDTEIGEIRLEDILNDDDDDVLDSVGIDDANVDFSQNNNNNISDSGGEGGNFNPFTPPAPSDLQTPVASLPVVVVAEAVTTMFSNVSSNF